MKHSADLKGTTVDSIIKDGFPVPSEGRDFMAGMLKLTRIRSSTYRVILCKVAVGKTLYLSNQLAGRKHKQNSAYDDDVLQDGIYLAEARDRMVKEQYESFYIKPGESEEMNVYRYEYRIFDSALVHPLYVIEFTFDPNKEAERKKPLCVECKREATKYCKNDRAYFCEEDYIKIHEGISILKDHEAVPIENRPRSYGMCQQHKEEFMFFCGRCKTTLCVSCKISGSHSSGEYANHKLMNIDEAYKDASDQSKTADPQTEKYKATLRNLLATVKDKIDSVAKNAQSTENELYERLREALDTLHKLTRAKISVLLADQLELQRRYDEIEWADNFLRFQYDVLEAKDYLKSWFRHLEAKGEIIMVQNLEISEVEADLRVVGKIGVTFGPIKTSDTM